MAKAVAVYEGGIHERKQIAVRFDGVVFGRYQVRDPRYGYKWSKWKWWHKSVDPNALPNAIDDMYGRSAPDRVRLPG